MAKSDDVFDPPLPAPAANMVPAKLEQFMPLRSDSFQALNASFEVRETDILRLSGGALQARVFRYRKGGQHSTPWHWHEWGFQIGYVTQGWALYEFEGIGKIRIEAGTFLFQMPNNRHRELDASDDFEGIEITLPGAVQTHAIQFNRETGKWEKGSLGE